MMWPTCRCVCEGWGRARCLCGTCRGRVWSAAQRVGHQTCGHRTCGASKWGASDVLANRVSRAPTSVRILRLRVGIASARTSPQTLPRRADTTSRVELSACATKPMTPPSGSGLRAQAKESVSRLSTHVRRLAYRAAP